MLLSMLFSTAGFSIAVATSCSNDCFTDPSVSAFCYIMGPPCLAQDSFTACDPYGCEMVAIRNQSDYVTMMAYRDCMGGDVWLPYRLDSTTGLWTHYRTGQVIGYVSWATGEPNGYGAATYMETYNGGLDDTYGTDAQATTYSPKWMCICYMCAPSADPNLIASKSWVIPNTTVSFACAAGYILAGAASLQCVAGGIWSGSLPTCASVTSSTQSVTVTTATPSSLSTSTPDATSSTQSVTVTTATSSSLSTAIPDVIFVTQSSITTTAIPASWSTSTRGIITSSQFRSTFVTSVLTTQKPTHSSGVSSVWWPLMLLTVLSFLLLGICLLMMHLLTKTDEIKNHNDIGTDPNEQEGHHSAKK